MNFFNSEFSQKSKFHWDFLKNIKNIDEWNILSKQFEKREMNKAKYPEIPKIIHQIWIGPNKLPRKYKPWMKSWLNKNPEYKYKLWTEKDIEKIKMRNALKYKLAKNSGLKSDIARYEILYLFGGIYVDTDFECLKKIPDDLLNYDFVSSIIFDFKPSIANGFMMSKKKSAILLEIMKNLEINEKFDIQDVIQNSGPGLLTQRYFKLSENIRNKCLILPSDYFYPYPNFLLNSKFKPKMIIERESIGFHHWEMSWMKNNLLIRIINKVKTLSKKINN